MPKKKKMMMMRMMMVKVSDGDQNGVELIAKDEKSG
jgi:hypothetical protein